MSRYFAIVGTNTDVGKTTVAVGLAKNLYESGEAVSLLKPVQTGCKKNRLGSFCAPDVSTALDACPHIGCEALVHLVEPCSPHLSAAIQNVPLTVADLSSQIQEWKKNSSCKISLIELAGGLLVPLNETETQRDLLCVLNIPIILVVSNTLGAINHALLTVEALQAKGIEIVGLIFTHTYESIKNPLDVKIFKDNQRIITKKTGIPCLASVPYIKELSSSSSIARSKGWDNVSESLHSAASTLLSFPKKEENTEKAKSSDLYSVSELIDFDRKHIWHPYTSAIAPLPVREAVATKGTRIILRDKTSLIDGMSSWWCAIHGYNHPILQQALCQQTYTMPHVMFGGLTHEPAVCLAKKLLTLVPQNLKHVFFADSGSVSVEVAMKMAIQYQQAKGASKKVSFLAPRGGYHGDTLDAMSVCDPVNGMHTLFSGILPKQLFSSRPTCRFDRYSSDSFGVDSSIKDFEKILEKKADSIAAVILEPILQGAGGMWMYHPKYLKKVRDLCNQYGCLLILDEIATGFGRTGKLFACEWADVKPDIMCIGKALTGGVLSLAATLATKDVAEGISQNGGVLMHGPTFMGNPLACAVANASLDILCKEEWKSQTETIERVFIEELYPCKDLLGVSDVRVLGAVGVLEMQKPVDIAKAQTYFVNKGVWIRPFGKLMYVMPPFVTTEEETRLLTGAMRSIVEDKEWF